MVMSPASSTEQASISVGPAKIATRAGMKKRNITMLSMISAPRRAPKLAYWATGAGAP